MDTVTLVTIFKGVSIMDAKNYLDIVKHTHLFKSFTTQELQELLGSRKCQIKKYGKNSIIHLQNEECCSMDVILTGRALVQKIDSNGNVLIITTFNTGDIMGGNLLFASNNTYPMTIISKSPSTVLHIKKDLILELCQINRVFLIEFLKSISDKTVIVTNKLKSITMKTIRQCIFEFLSVEYHNQKNNTIKLNISKKELAERIGIQRPSLSRELNKMRRDGLVEYDANSITIKDMSIINDTHI